MSTAKPHEIPHKQYASEFRQIRKLYSLGSSELIVLKSVLSKKTFVALQKDMSGQHESAQILLQMASFLQGFDSKGISKFIGYVNCTIWDNIQLKQVKRLVLIFESCNRTLETIVHNAKSHSKQQTAKLLCHLLAKIMDILVELQANNIDLSYVLIDYNVVTMDGWQEVGQQVKLMYLPFKFINQGFLSLKNFANCIYSSSQLERINLKERKALPYFHQILNNSPSNTHLQSGANRGILQKIGLLLTKITYQLNPQVLLQPQFSLYTMNGQFNIDLNWVVIHRLLEQCSKLKGYPPIVRVIRLMIEGCKDETTFCNYRQMLNQNSIETANMHRSYHQQALIKLKSIEEKIHSVSSCLKYSDGAIYKGNLKNGVRQGCGIHYFAEGEIYGGQWSNDQMSGQGFYAFINGQTYEGHVITGIKEGQGLYKYRNGDYYSGHWHNDLKQGQGELFNAVTGQKYVGLFSNNLKNGTGTIYQSNGHRFQGIFVNGLKNGEGCMLDELSRIYLRGHWKNGELEGTVQIFLSNGDYYRGQLKDDKKDGRGIYQYAISTVYEGDFINDEQSGQCIIQYSNGDKYEGGVRKGLFQGEGKYLYRNSELIYEGSWSKGVADGAGQYYYCQTVNLSTVIDKGELQTHSLRTMEAHEVVPAFADDIAII